MEYSEQQVRQVLDEVGIDVVSDTSTNFLCLCPFHGNTHSPAMSVSKRKGLWMCFNDACSARGSLSSLVSRLQDITPSAAMRVIGNFATTQPFDLDLDVDDFEYVKVDEEWWERARRRFMEHQETRAYGNSRGFTDDTMSFFNFASMSHDGMEYLLYPVHTPDGEHIAGYVGRSIRGKSFYNMKGLQRGKLLFNIHRARKYSQRAIVVESGFDAMLLYQEGFRNVVATMGSKVSNEQISLLERNFSSVLSFADNDDAGRAMTDHIEEKFRGPVLTARLSRDTMWPTGAKDVGDLNASQMRTMISNADTWI